MKAREDVLVSQLAGTVKKGDVMKEKVVEILIFIMSEMQENKQLQRDRPERSAEQGIHAVGDQRRVQLAL